jgi:hypothetical protein
MINNLTFLKGFNRNINNLPSAVAYETGWTLPSIGENYAGSNPVWTNPGNITTLSTASVATNLLLNVSYTRELIARGFNFDAISDLATIDGIAVRVNMKASLPDSNDVIAKLLISSSLAGTNLATTTILASSYTLRSYGNSTATWGNTLSPAIVKASSFGFGIAIDNPNDTYDDISIASVEMNVYYTV